MKKFIAATQFEVLSTIKKRWSPRAFSTEIPDVQILRRMFEASRWAASSYNEQPWRFIIGIKGKTDTYERIFSTLKSNNQEWASSAPILMINCCKMTFTHKGKENRCAAYDTGAAVAQMILQLQSEGVLARQIAGFFPAQAIAAFNIPEDFRPICAMAIGYSNNSDNSINEALPTRVRNSFDDFIFTDSWNKRSDLF